MYIKWESTRFWIPVVILLAFTGYVGQKLVKAHLHPTAEPPPYVKTWPLKALRGTIYDCNGRSCPLARTVPYWDYYLDPVDLTNRYAYLCKLYAEKCRNKKKGKWGAPPRTPQAVLKTVAHALNLDYEKVKRMGANTRNQYQLLATSDDKNSHEIMANPRYVYGVAIREHAVRQYPHGNRLSNVLGFVDTRTHVGVTGLERMYERQLAGTNGYVRAMTNASGRMQDDKLISRQDATNGCDIVLTVDQNLQFEAEKELVAGVAEFGAAAGWCVILDAKTAAVKAMASVPDFEPGNYRHSNSNNFINRVTNYTYEPGSVMKVITAAAAIDLGRCTPDTLYSSEQHDTRYYRLPGDHGHRWPTMLSIREAVVHSSNIVIGKLGVDIGPEKLWCYMRAFGFGLKTGVEVFREDSSRLRNWRSWDKATWSRAPIGQGVSVTAMQMASAYQAIANKGERLRPYLVDRIVNADGVETYRHQRKVVARPIRPETARTMLNIMTGVTSGTARKAAIKGYSVAGKTGTAQKVINGHYSDKLYYATFCGIVPASDPRFVCLVTLDFDTCPKCHAGGNTSAVIFSRLSLKTLRYLMVEPDRPGELEDEIVADNEVF